MATSSSSSLFQLLPLSKPYLSINPKPKHQTPAITYIPRCSITTTTTQNPTPELPKKPNTTTDTEPPPLADATTTSFSVTKRVPSLITPERRRRMGLVKPEPPNFEIGWKRTKEIKNEKPRGWAIADFFEKLETLMAKGQYGSSQLLGTVAAIVADRVREEAEVLREEGGVEERVLMELNRVVRLVEMDVEMVKAAAKEETRKERIETACARCKQAALVALSL